LLDEDAATDMLSWQASGGFSVDGSVRVEGEDPRGSSGWCATARVGPLALERLQALDGQDSLASPDARLLYQLSEPDLQGRTGVLLSPLELLDRLARLIPPPRIHRHRYHGLLAPHARLRSAVVAIGREGERTQTTPEGVSGQGRRAQLPAPSPAADRDLAPRSVRIAWALLLARIYEVLPLLCPACGGEMRILAFLTDPPVVKGILLHLGLPQRPPSLSPARAPPQAEIDFDQSLGVDPTVADPEPNFDFDQSAPEAWDS
jgi:hypothetical protein